MRCAKRDGESPRDLDPVQRATGNQGMFRTDVSCLKDITTLPQAEVQDIKT